MNNLVYIIYFFLILIKKNDNITNYFYILRMDSTDNKITLEDTISILQLQINTLKDKLDIERKEYREMYNKLKIENAELREKLNIL